MEINKSKIDHIKTEEKADNNNSKFKDLEIFVIFIDMCGSTSLKSFEKKISAEGEGIAKKSIWLKKTKDFYTLCAKQVKDFNHTFNHDLNENWNDNSNINAEANIKQILN